MERKSHLGHSLLTAMAEYCFNTDLKTEEFFCPVDLADNTVQCGVFFSFYKHDLYIYMVVCLVFSFFKFNQTFTRCNQLGTFHRILCLY